MSGDRTHNIENADHLVVRLERDGNEGFHRGLFDDLQEGRIRIFPDIVADEERLAAGDHSSTEPFSLPETGAGYSRASRPSLRPDHEFVALIFTQCQHAGVGLEKSASALHDQIKRWLKTDLRADLLANLIERSRFRDFSLQCVLVPLECSSHVIERLRKPSNLVLLSDVDNNVAPSSGYLVRSIG